MANKWFEVYFSNRNQFDCTNIVLLRFYLWEVVWVDPGSGEDLLRLDVEDLHIAIVRPTDQIVLDENKNDKFVFVDLEHQSKKMPFFHKLRGNFNNKKSVHSNKIFFL